MTLSPKQVYEDLVAYAERKTRNPWDKTALAGIMAGLWIGIYGHASMVFGGFFWHPESIWAPGVSLMTYGLVFPGCLMFIMFTGADLFTGNVAAMVILLFEKKLRGKYWLAMLKVWSMSLVFNFLGAVLAAGALTFTSGAFYEGSTQLPFLEYLGAGKLTKTFGEAVCAGVMCNAVVCATIWCIVMADEVISKCFCAWFLIATFCWGKFEHSVANFYTLCAYKFVANPSDVSWGSIIVKNWIPVVIGNILGGMIIDGMVWWYTHSSNCPGLLPCSLLKEPMDHLGSMGKGKEFDSPSEVSGEDLV